MAASKVATIGCSFEGDCSKHHHGHFTGTFQYSGSVVVSINDRQVCVTGTVGQATCGCWVQAIGQSKSIALNGLPVARLGDPIVEVSRVAQKGPDGNDLKDEDGNTVFQQDARGNPVVQVVAGGSITGTITSGVDFLAID